MTANLLAWVAQATVLAAAAAILPALLRLRAPRPRLIFWQAALALVIVLPVLQPWHTPTAPVPVAAAIEATGIDIPPPADWQPAGWWLPAVLAAGALFRLSWLGLGMVTLAGYRAGARPLVPTAGWRSLAARLGIAPEVKTSPRVTVPVTFGLRRPTILVPPSFDDLSPEARTAALCHEMVHVARGDARTVFLEEVVRAALWFHPGVWLLLGRIALAREQVVDRQAVALVGDRRCYLETLYQLASAPRWPVLAVPFGSRSHLLARVRLLTQEIIMTPARSLLSTAGLAGATVLVLALCTATFPMVTAAAAEGEILRVEGDVQPPKRLAGDPPAYPEDARKDRVVGKVVLQTVIDKAGEIDEVEVVESVDERLSAAASDAVRTWRFAPATLEGRPVAVYYNLTINFRLDEDKADGDDG